jgi:hypothetical protein
MTTVCLRRLMTLCALLTIALISACGSDDESKASRQASSQAAIDPGASDGTLPEVKDGKIRCDQFVIGAERVDDHLEVWIETDLPDTTEIYLTVYRSFFAKDSEKSAGALTYYSNPRDGTETVGRWRNRIRIPIDDRNARAEIEEQMQYRAIMGRPSALDRVESSVGLIAGLLASQKDPRFEAGLVGRAVEEMDPGINIVSHRTAVDWAFSGSWQIGPFGNPEDLRPGTTYVLERDTALMPYHELRGNGSVDSTAEQIASARTLPAGTSFTVRQRLEKTTTNVWYEVDAIGLIGWINGIALTAQVLPVRSVGPAPVSETVAPEVPSDEIAQRCETEWEGDFAMQVDCRNEQAKSWQALQAAQTALKREPIWIRIEATCRNEWRDQFGYDYAMTEYCAAEQIEAAKALGAF